MAEHEVLVPALEHFIVKIDREKKQVHLNVPEGLIDIYTGNKKDSEDEIELE